MNSVQETPNTTTNPMVRQLAEMECLVKDLNKMLVQYESAIDEQDIREQFEAVERWAESYRRGLRAAAKLSETGCDLLEEIRSKLKLAADELTRMEGESPNTNAVNKTARKSEDYLRLVRTIEVLLPKLELLVDCEEESTLKEAV